ncbi:MAG TPA: DUF3662 and FHA domain-containing protein [Acidimicrobiia bacterium]
MGLQRFERRLERLVEGTFSKAFRSGGIQPVEIGRRVGREMDAGRTLGVRGTVAPNRFTIWLSNDDLERFSGFHDALARELADAAREHGRDEGYQFEGLIEVVLVVDEQARRGDLRIDAEIVGDGAGTTSTLVLPDGGRVALGDEPTVIGRTPDCAIALSDPQVSRHHAEIRRGDFGFRIVDLGSTNGTQVNGVVVKEHSLAGGDVIVVGATSLRYEES